MPDMWVAPATEVQPVGGVVTDGVAPEKVPPSHRLTNAMTTSSASAAASQKIETVTAPSA